MCEKTKINEKEAGVGPFKQSKIVSTVANLINILHLKNYDSRVVITSKLHIFTTLES